MVMAQAKTGKDINNKAEVTFSDQANSWVLYNVMHFTLQFTNVTIIFIAPNREERPAKCMLNIAKSTEELGWNSKVDKGG